MTTNSVHQLPAYVQSELNKIAKAEGFTDYTFIVNDGCKKGDGFLATLISVTISNSANTKKLALICKMMPEDEAHRDLFDNVLLFGREIYMYKTVLPIMAKFQCDHGLTQQTGGFFAYPKCYTTILDENTDQFLIIMEDLRSKGFHMLDKKKEMSVDNANQVMAAMGQFHGVSYALRDQKPDIFDEFRSLKDIAVTVIETTRILDDLYGASYDLCLELFADDGSEDLLEPLRYLKKSWKDIAKECRGINVAEPFSVLFHGDCWNNNLMFSDEQVIF